MLLYTSYHQVWGLNFTIISEHCKDNYFITLFLFLTAVRFLQLFYLLVYQFAMFLADLTTLFVSKFMSEVGTGLLGVCIGELFIIQKWLQKHTIKFYLNFVVK